VSAPDTPRRCDTLRTLAPGLGTAESPYAESVLVPIGALLWIVAAVGYFLAEAIAAAALPGYSYTADYISMLGQLDRSPHANLMNAAFVAQGVLFPVGAILLVCGARAGKALAFLAFAMINGIGNIVVATLHSGVGARMHVVGAALAIVGGNAAVLAGGAVLLYQAGSRTHRMVSVVLGTAGLGCLIATALGWPAVGVWERGSVYPTFVWQMFTAVELLRRRARSARSSVR
jgi:hypothetical membrane protein